MLTSRDREGAVRFRLPHGRGSSSFGTSMHKSRPSILALSPRLKILSHRQVTMMRMRLLWLTIGVLAIGAAVSITALVMTRGTRGNVADASKTAGEVDLWEQE